MGLGEQAFAFSFLLIDHKRGRRQGSKPDAGAETVYTSENFIRPRGVATPVL
jgi:hypothetical protein